MAAPRLLFARSTTLGVGLFDQFLFGLGGFAVSWMAARQLSSPDLATFAIAWQWAFGTIAVISEAIIVPAVLRFARAPTGVARFQARTVETLVVWSVATLALAGVVSTAWPEIAIGMAVIGVAVGGTAFAVVRGLRYATGDVVGSARLNVIRLSVTVASLAGAVAASVYSAHVALTIGGAAFIFAAAWGGWPRHRPRDLASAIRPLLSHGMWYSGATLIRIIGYSAGLLLLTEWVRGSADTAAIAGILILAGPTQLIAASLPLLFMAELSAVGESNVGFRRLLGRQLVSMVVLLAAGLGLAALVFHWWVTVTIGDAALRSDLVSDFVPFAALVGAMTLSSWIAAAFKALHAPRLFTVTTLVGAAAALGAVWTSIPAVWLASIPYLLVTPAMAAVVVGLTRGPGAILGGQRGAAP